MITILGGGISGLSCAYELSKHKIPFRLLEGSNRVGGVIKSERINGYLLEFGANSTFNDETLTSICEELGLPFLTAKAVSKNRYVYKNNKINALPSGPLSLISSSYFSWKAKLTILKELKHKPQQPTEDETVSAFFLRHFNQEILDTVIDPFVGGIYATSPDELTISECFPKMVEIEKEFGSVLKGFMKTKSKGKRKEIISFKNGLQELADAIYNVVKDNILLNQKVVNLSISDNGSWTIKTNEDTYESNYIINCLPPVTSGQLFQSIDNNFSASVNAIKSPSVAVVHTVLDKEIFLNKLDGFGCLIPSKERETIAGCIWNSSIFENRCPENVVLLTNIVTNNSDDILSKNEDELTKAVVKDLERIFSINQLNPIFSHVFRYTSAIPQYDANIRKAREHFESLEKKNVYTATNWSKEVSVVGSVKNGVEVSKKIISLYSN